LATGIEERCFKATPCHSMRQGKEMTMFCSETAQIQVFITTMANDLLLYNNSYWQEKLGPEFRKNNLENKLHLIFSLLVFLEISLAQFLTFTFSSKIEKVKSRASRFMGYTETANDEDTCFPPSAIWHMWLENFPKCKLHIYEMIRPVAVVVSSLMTRASMPFAVACSAWKIVSATPNK